MAVNWSLAGGNNALAMFQFGAQLGQNMVDRREEREHRNALLAIRQQEADVKASEAQRDARTREVQSRAAQGDPAAMAELSGLDLNAWRDLSADQRTAANDKVKVLGNAALDVLNRPPEQRAAAWDAYIGQLASQMPELSQYAGKYSEEAARSVVAQAEMMGKLHEMESPHYQAIPAGGTLVDTGNPGAVQQYMQQGGGAQIPSVSSPQEAMRLPPGSQFLLPDGRVGTVPGGPGGSPSGAGFP